MYLGIFWWGKPCIEWDRARSGENTYEIGRRRSEAIMIDASKLSTEVGLSYHRLTTVSVAFTYGSSTLCTASLQFRWLALTIKPPTNPNSVFPSWQLNIKKRLPNNLTWRLILKLFDASASRIMIRCIGELHAVRNLT